MTETVSRTLAVAFLLSSIVGCGGEQRTSNTAYDEAGPSEGMTPASSDRTSPTTHDEFGMIPPPEPAAASTSVEAASSGTPATPLSNEQIAMIAELANSAEVEQGKLAQTKAKSPEVKKFAAMMVKHHTEAKNEQAKLFKELSLTPAQSQQGSLLKDDTDQALSSLRSVDGKDFDVAYMNSQVEAHEKVLATIDRDLLPAAQSEPKLAQSLTKMRATVEQHLTEAKQIQTALASQSPSSP